MRSSRETARDSQVKPRHSGEQLWKARAFGEHPDVPRAARKAERLYTRRMAKKAIKNWKERVV